MGLVLLIIMLNTICMSSNVRIYEINTRVWLHELSNLYSRKVTFENIPPQQWLKIRNLGCNWVWLMGVWQKSLISQELARKDTDLHTEFDTALPSWTQEDVVGSPYAVKDYSVSYDLGDEESLLYLVDVLHHYGMKLMLDFVPNHLACDHHWVFEHPKYFIQQMQSNPKSNFEVNGHYLAKGKDPNYAPWKDTAQLNYFNPDLRRAAIAEIKRVSRYCDGLRCDMAMLVTNDVFQKTWQTELTQQEIATPDTEFWSETITDTKSQNPSFLFAAECYWDTEQYMQSLGFDLTYDKQLYDHLLSSNAEDVKSYIFTQKEPNKWLRFIENHDEMRAISSFGKNKSKAAFLLASSIPGACLLHQGQELGLHTKLPVQLIRKKQENEDSSLTQFYRIVGKLINRIPFGKGIWNQLQVEGWPDNSSYVHIIAFEWIGDTTEVIIAINYSNTQSQGKLRIHCDQITDEIIKYTDVFTNTEYKYHKSKMEEEGLFVDLHPWQFHAFVRL